MLNKQFPELCEEAGVQSGFAEVKVKPVKIGDIKMDGFNIARLKTFEVSREKFPELDCDSDVVITVLKTSEQELVPGKIFVVEFKVRNVLECGRVCKIESLDLYFFENDSNPSPFTSEDVVVIGEAVGYCSVDEIDDKATTFRPIP